MKFFIYSKCGEGAGLGKVLKDEGHSVQLCIKESDYSSVYRGILEHSNKADKDALVIFDSSGMGRAADQMKADGFKVFGASRFHDKLENDRKFGLEFMTRNGIEVPASEEFTDWTKAEQFIKKGKWERAVFKPSGDLPSELTYCGSDAEDLLGYMRYVEKYFSSDIDSFVLQQFIPGNVLSTEIFVGPNGFVQPFNHTIEVKKFMDGDLGPSTGCAGNIVWGCEDEDEICAALRSCEKELVGNGYVGPIDLNCIVNEKGFYGLEWTPRFGLDAVCTWLHLLENDLSYIFDGIYSGKLSKYDLSELIAGGVRITIPPYPLEQDKVSNLKNEGIPIRGMALSDISAYFYEVQLIDGELEHSTGTGVIACISDSGPDSGAGIEMAYEIIDECQIPDLQYRTDLDKVLPKMYVETTEILCNLV